MSYIEYSTFCGNPTVLCVEDTSSTVKHDAGSIMLSITLGCFGNIEKFKKVNFYVRHCMSVILTYFQHHAQGFTCFCNTLQLTKSKRNTEKFGYLISLCLNRYQFGSVCLFVWLFFLYCQAF